MGLRDTLKRNPINQSINQNTFV